MATDHKSGSIRWWVRPAVWLALPFAIRWVRKQERRIIEKGNALSDQEKTDAETAGVKDIEMVRVLIVSSVPTPSDGFLGWIARLVRFSVIQPAGMALGHGIYLARSAAQNRHILAHELAHVAQYERLDGIRGFLRPYLIQCLNDGYDHAAMEIEAEEIAVNVCNDSENENV